MRKRFLVGVVGAGLVGVVGLGAEGCGNGATGTSTGTGGATASSAAPSSSTGGVTTGTGGSGDGHSFATATSIDTTVAVAGNLSPTGAVDYYKFTGTKGQSLAIFTTAQGSVSGAAFSPSWIDTVITLYDSNQKQLAENNDTVPSSSGDSEIFTILPANGTYYVRVEECWTWATTPATACLGTADKANTAYSLSLVRVDPTIAGTVLDKEPGGSAANATAITFDKSSGGYFLGVLYDTFTGAADVDVFSFTIPADAVTVPSNERGVVSFWPLRAGTSDDGSTTPLGKMYVTDTLDTANHLAEFSGTDYQTQPTATAHMWPPLDLTKSYLLWVEHPATAAGSNDFYYVLQGQGTSNPVETNDVANDSATTPELPADSPDSVGGHNYYLDGDILKKGADVDFWQMPVGTTTQIAVSCSSQRAGSGVRGFTVDVVDPTAPATKIATVTETATTDAFLAFTAIPAGVTHVAVKLSATSQDAVVTGTFYHCGVHLK